MGERILVTGGAGFVGSHLVDALLADGHEVRILDSIEPQVHGANRQIPSYVSPHAELIVGSVLDPVAVAKALDGIDILFHQAAQVGVGQSMYDVRRYVMENTGGAAVLLEEVLTRRERLRKMVVASSMSIYGEGSYRTAVGEVRYPRLRTRKALERGQWEMVEPESGEELTPIPTAETKPLAPTSVYAVTKRDHEELFLSVGYAYGIPTVALRYFNIYGDRQSLSNPYTGVAAIFSSRLMNDNPPVIFEDGTQSRDFVHVSDIVRANVLAMEKDAADYEVLNVGSGTSTNIRQVAETLAEHLGRADIEGRITGTFREGDIRHCYADITKIRTLLGYEPTVTFHDGMKELVSWVKDQTPVDMFEQAHKELSSRGLA